MQTFRCSRCAQVVFFENVRCERCGSALGYVPEEQKMQAFQVDPDASWRAWVGDTLMQAASLWKPCDNYARQGVCNWMVSLADGNGLCRCCRYTAIIPALSKRANKDRWFRLEAAKRRLFFSLFKLDLPLPDRLEDPEHGLVFQFLEATRGGPAVLTGHNQGVITMNIAEADDVKREAQRTRMKEPYRTLLGHFRHEIGHFYWDLLVAGRPALDGFRRCFGDETQDYRTALDTYYAQGPVDHWQQLHISAYASSHPWEDWAESWAHYLHVMDALDTAHHWGFDLKADFVEPRRQGHQERLTLAPEDFRTSLIEQWLPLSLFLNSMGRSLGQGDYYPFVLPAPVLDKLCFIHDIVMQAPHSSSPPHALSSNAAAPETTSAETTPV